MLDWDDLRFFLAVTRGGSFSAAARTLGVTQPTVGRRLAALEKRLGARLFQATPTGQEPSRTGLRLLAGAERMEAEALAIERVASGRDVGLRGLVRLTASEWMVDRVLAPVLPPLLARHPELEVDLVGESRHVNLIRREADIAVRPSRFEHQELIERPAGALSFGLYASDGYLAAWGTPDFARGCEGFPLVAMSESLTRVPDVDWLARVAPRARVVARANGRIPMATLAVEGVGMAVLPHFVGDATPSLRLLEPPQPGPERSLWMALHRDARNTPRVKATFDFLRAALGRLEGALCPRSSRPRESTATGPTPA